MFDIEFLKKCMISEGTVLSDKLFERLIELGEHLEYKTKKMIIYPGEISDSIWIVASGFVKTFYFDGKKEYVSAFSGTGTIFLSALGYMLGKPSFYGWQTITNCDLLRINKKDFDSLRHESIEFANWIFEISLMTFGVYENKLETFSESDSLSLYKKLLKNKMSFEPKEIKDYTRQELMKVVSSKDLASYLGITPSYLSNIRKLLIEEDKRQNHLPTRNN